MDREYFQHAINDAVTLSISAKTRAVVFFATSGMIALYALSAGHFFISPTPLFNGLAWESPGNDSITTIEGMP